MAPGKSRKALVSTQPTSTRSPLRDRDFDTAGLRTQLEPVINGATADLENLMCLHFAQTTINGSQDTQAQIYTVGFSHLPSVAYYPLTAIPLRSGLPETTACPINMKVALLLVMANPDRKQKAG